jgi:hypothetical protein
MHQLLLGMTQLRVRRCAAVVSDCCLSTPLHWTCRSSISLSRPSVFAMLATFNSPTLLSSVMLKRPFSLVTSLFHISLVYMSFTIPTKIEAWLPVRGIRPAHCQTGCAQSNGNVWKMNWIHYSGIQMTHNLICKFHLCKTK